MYSAELTPPSNLRLSILIKEPYSSTAHASWDSSLVSSKPCPAGTRRAPVGLVFHEKQKIRQTKCILGCTLEFYLGIRLAAMAPDQPPDVD